MSPRSRPDRRGARRAAEGPEWNKSDLGGFVRKVGWASLMKFAALVGFWRDADARIVPAALVELRTPAIFECCLAQCLRSALVARSGTVP